MASTLLLVLVFVLDLIAFGLAVAAEQRRATVSSFAIILLLFCSFLYVLLLYSSFIFQYHTIYYCIGVFLVWVCMFRNRRNYVVAILEGK